MSHYVPHALKYFTKHVTDPQQETNWQENKFKLTAKTFKRECSESASLICLCKSYITG